MVMSDWFLGSDCHWLMPEWRMRKQPILSSFSYLAVASILIMTVHTLPVLLGYVKSDLASIL